MPAGDAAILAPVRERAVDPSVDDPPTRTGAGTRMETGTIGSLDALPPAVRDHAGQTVTLTLNRFGWAGTAWMLPQMQRSKRALRRVPDLLFHVLMGTGGGAGFSTRPNPAVWTLLCAWPSGRAAAAALDAPPFRDRHARARETMTLFLAPTACRGSWAGHGFEPGRGADDAAGPVAALTRASVRARALVPFWHRVPAISDALVLGSEARFAIGMGEVPYLHQVTFSIWDDVPAMRRFAGGAAHGEAARQVYENGWFAEEMFARFRVLGAVGSWGGRSAREIAGKPMIGGGSR